MLLIPVPIYGVKMSSKTFGIADDTNGIRESFLSLSLFSLTFKNYFFSLAVLKGRAIAPIGYKSTFTRPYHVVASRRHPATSDVCLKICLTIVVRIFRVSWIGHKVLLRFCPKICVKVVLRSFVNSPLVSDANLYVCVYLPCVPTKSTFLFFE